MERVSESSRSAKSGRDAFSPESQDGALIRATRPSHPLASWQRRTHFQKFRGVPSFINTGRKGGLSRRWTNPVESLAC